MKLTNCIISESGITTIIGGQPYQVGTEHPNYNKLLVTLKTKDGDEFLKLYHISKPVKVVQNKVGFKSTSSLVVGHETVTYNGQPLHGVVINRLLDLQDEGHDVGPLSKFLEKLLRNPSKWCVDALYTFLEAKGLPITEEGNCLGYKCVTRNFQDKYSQTVDNRVGTTHEILRNTVDDDRTKECSYGFHIGDLSYSGPNGYYHSSGDIIVICEFSPEDVVAVPQEASSHKIRCCKYKVVGLYKEDLPSTIKVLSIEDLVHGDKIEFCPTTWHCKALLKFEGINKRSKGTRFFGRLLKDSDYGTPGQSASFLISEVSDVKKV